MMEDESKLPNFFGDQTKEGVDIDGSADCTAGG